MKQRVLITGITGQDGVYLSNLLLRSNNYEILGTSRTNEETIMKKKLIYLGNDHSQLENLKILKCNIHISEEIESLVESFRPEYVYNLIGPGSVSQSVEFREKLLQGFRGRRLGHKGNDDERHARNKEADSRGDYARTYEVFSAIPRKVEEVGPTDEGRQNAGHHPLLGCPLPIKSGKNDRKQG